MKKNYNTFEALQFLAENDLNEVFFDKSQNHFLVKDIKNQLPLTADNENNFFINNQETMPKKITKVNDRLPNNNAKNISDEKMISPVFSTDSAIANLAKKNQTLSENSVQKNNLEEKFIPINDIISSAKNLANNCQTLAELKNAITQFDGCNLKKMATNTVFCDGNPDSKIMVIGEAPGNHEDLQGIPFCGDSGAMLNEMLMSINLDRQKDFYITNVIFWRPPGNRRPTDEELAICRPFFERHIELFAPKIIILVGATAMSSILDISDPITKVRGQILDYNANFLSSPTKIFTIFHPSFLMRQPMKKKLVWQDMLTLEKFIKNNF
jgi:DNA polymerase